MAVKTITIDIEAYKRLKGAKRTDESFSQAIKRLVKPPFDYDAWLRTVEKARLSSSFFDAIERQIRGRKQPSRSRARGVS